MAPEVLTGHSVQVQVVALQVGKDTIDRSHHPYAAGHFGLPVDMAVYHAQEYGGRMHGCKNEDCPGSWQTVHIHFHFDQLGKPGIGHSTAKGEVQNNRRRGPEGPSWKLEPGVPPLVV